MKSGNKFITVLAAAAFLVMALIPVAGLASTAPGSITATPAQPGSGSYTLGSTDSIALRAEFPAEATPTPSPTAEPTESPSAEPTNDDGSETTYSVAITPTTAVTGQSTTLTATVTPAAPADATYEWTGATVVDATPSTATFSSPSAGSVDVTVTVKDSQGETLATATQAITVSDASISLNQSALSLTVGATGTLEATTNPQGADVTWESSAPSIATVANGTVTAVAAGSATITAKITVGGQEKTATCSVTVEAASPGRAARSLTAGTVTWTATMGGADVTDSVLSGVTGVSGGAATAAFGGTEHETGLTAGTCTVTAANAGQTVTFTITVAGNSEASETPAPSASAEQPAPTPTAPPTMAPAPATSAPIVIAPPASATATPTTSASTEPTTAPSAAPSASESAQPTTEPTTQPSEAPSTAPTAEPSVPVEIRPDAPDMPADVEVVADPETGGSVLEGVPIGTPQEVINVESMTDWIEAPEGAVVEVRTAEGETAPPDAPVGTGMVIEVVASDGSVLQSTVVVVRGDVTGSGEMNLTQLVRMAAGYTGSDPLSGVFAQAADLNGDDQLSLTDLVIEARMYREADIDA